MESLSVDSQIHLIVSIILLLISIIVSISILWSLFFIRHQFSVLPYQFIIALSIYEIIQNISNIFSFIKTLTNHDTESFREIISLLTLPTNLSFSFLLISLLFNRFLHISFSNLHNKFCTSSLIKVFILSSIIIFILRFVLCLLPQFTLNYSPNQLISNFSSITQHSSTVSAIETTVHLFFVSLLLLFLFIFSLLFIFQNIPLISRDDNPTLIISILISIYQSIFIVFWQNIILNGGTQTSLIILQFILVFRPLILSLLIVSIPRSRSSSIQSLRRKSEERTTTSSSILRLPKDTKENRSGNSNWKKRLTGDLKVANAALAQDKVKYLT